jgi:hypothetical protein
MEPHRTKATVVERPCSPEIKNPSLSEPSFVDALVDPLGMFRNIGDVIQHPWFTHQEKRTILLSWVRDELVAEHAARQAASALLSHSRVDDVITALSHVRSSRGERVSLGRRETAPKRPGRTSERTH